MANDFEDAEEILRNFGDELTDDAESLINFFLPARSKPRVTRRKRWEDLTPGYRRRLERRGITPEKHAGGTSLYSARGHAAREEYLRHLAEGRYRQRVRDWADKQAELYYRDADETYDYMLTLDPAFVEHIIETQTQAENRYMNQGIRTPEFWESREQGYPEWLYYYHGVFS